MNDSRPTTPTVNPNTALFEGTELDPIAGDVDREVKRVMRRGLPDGSDPLVSVDGRRVSDFDSPVARAVAAVLEQLNDPEFLRTSELSPAWLKAETTGYTLRPSTAETEKTPVIDRTRERDVLTVYNRGFSRLHKPESLYCLHFAETWKLAFYPDGQHQVRHFACGKCVNCVEWRKVEIAHQYALVRGDWQTVVKVGGFRDPDAANKWSDAQGDRAGGQRHRMMRWNPDTGFELAITYNRVLDARAIALTERDIERKGLEGGVEVCELLPLDFRAMLPDETTFEGPAGKKRHASHFTGWPGYVQAPDVYATSDPTIYVNDFHAPEPTEITSIEKERAKIDPELQADLWAADWFRDTRPINIGTFEHGVDHVADLDPDHETIATIREQSGFEGPTTLLVDAMRYQAFHVAQPKQYPWRRAYRHVLTAAGVHDMPPLECVAPKCSQLAVSQLGLCIVCELERGA